MMSAYQEGLREAADLLELVPEDVHFVSAGVNFCGDIDLHFGRFSEAETFCQALALLQKPDSQTDEYVIHRWYGQTSTGRSIDVCALRKRVGD
jgi:hypothetical protein